MAFEYPSTITDRKKKKQKKLDDKVKKMGKKSDKKLLKYSESKESQLHAKDFDKGVNRAEDRAIKETMQEAGMPMSKGGRAGFKMGSKCKLAKAGQGRAYGKNS